MRSSGVFAESPQPTMLMLPSLLRMKSRICASSAVFVARKKSSLCTTEVFVSPRPPAAFSPSACDLMYARHAGSLSGTLGLPSPVASTTWFVNTLNCLPLPSSIVTR